MLKLRTMVIGADRAGIDSTAAGDARLTPIGKWLRRYKIDELPQLLNVLWGTMSLVGPRPNVPFEVALYTKQELRLLSVHPGITDLASIVFSDLAEVIGGAEDANLAYGQLVRPWKGSLGLFYVDHTSTALDLWIIWLTIVSFVDRDFARREIDRLLEREDADPLLRAVVRGDAPPKPAPPVGGSSVVQRRP